MSLLRTFVRTQRAAAALEFALVAVVFIPLCLATIQVGIVIWTLGALQTAVSLSARCAALSGEACQSIPGYAVVSAETWTYPGVITTANVTPAPHTTCVGGVLFMVVTITSDPYSFAGISAAFNLPATLSTAYYPMPTSTCS